MANPTSLQKHNGKHLWFALLGLGFQPDTATSSIAGKSNINCNVKYINLGPNMFDKPNKDAFYIVMNFLLERLNPARFNEAYRHCWPVLNHKADAEYRKVTCAWLREIMLTVFSFCHDYKGLDYKHKRFRTAVLEETANAGSKVVASLFLSPGGPKFVSLMLHLANHVLVQEMKTFTTDDSWVPEAAAMPASSLDMATKRLNLINSRFLKAAVDQDRFLHEYQRRAQTLVKSMRDIRAEGAKYDELLKCHSCDSTEEGASVAEKAKRVRLLWSTIDEMLSAIKAEQHAVECVLRGDVDQYVLDGMDRVLKIPQCLLERVEQLPHQLSSGNVYEAGELNLLSVLELTNHALQLLREERCRVSHAPQLQLNPQDLQEKCQQMARMLQDLQLIRQKISKEGIPEVRSTIRELESEWDRKWMDTLKDTPLVSFLNEDPALGFLSPMAPLSFEPATDTSYRTSVFFQYPAMLREENPAESKSQEDTHPVSCSLKSSCPEVSEKCASPIVSTEVSSQANTSLDWLFDTPAVPPLHTPPVPPPQSSVRKTTHVLSKASPIRSRSRILDMECDNLADQFADAVTTTSPTEGRVKGRDLEALLGTLHGDPFSTRKQLPRTPESLIMDVKNSWRKALEEDKAEKTGQSAKLHDSVTGRLTPLLKPHSAPPSPEAPPQSFSSRTPAASSHSVLLRSTLLWDTYSAEPLDSSGAVQFSLDQETLPEMPSCDSLLSLDDEAVEVKGEEEEEDELLIPSLKMEAIWPPQATGSHLGPNQQQLDDGRKKTPECLLSDLPDRDWLTEPAQSVEASDKVFSLDLDTLETPSPPKKQEYSLPKLITFSPM